MQLKMNITTASGARAVAIRPKAIVGWELKHSRKISELAQGIGMSDMSWLAWRQLTDEGSTSSSFDEWLDELVDVEPIVEDPTGLPEGASSE